MTFITLTEAKNYFSKTIRRATQEPLIVTRDGIPVAIIAGLRGGKHLEDILGHLRKMNGTRRRREQKTR